MSSNDNHNDQVQPIIIINRKKAHAGHAHSTAWKIALADFMTTMMILFFVLWVVTLTPEDKKKQLVEFFQGKDQAQKKPDRGILPESTGKFEKSGETQLYAAIQAEFRKIDPSMAMVYINSGRLEIDIKTNGLFETASTKVTPKFKALFKKIAVILKPKDVYIDIYGYTDARPFGMTGNLMLSVGRATSAAQEFISNGIKADQLGIHGEGERFPVSTNDTEEGMALNRRIVIYISPKNLEEKRVDGPDANNNQKTNSSSEHASDPHGAANDGSHSTNNKETQKSNDQGNSAKDDVNKNAEPKADAAAVTNIISPKKPNLSTKDTNGISLVPISASNNKNNISQITPISKNVVIASENKKLPNNPNQKSNTQQAKEKAEKSYFNNQLMSQNRNYEKYFGSSEKRDIQ